MYPLLQVRNHNAMMQHRIIFLNFGNCMRMVVGHNNRQASQNFWRQEDPEPWPKEVASLLSDEHRWPRPKALMVDPAQPAAPA